MVEYRPFRNGDPPQLVRLWHQCRLGRGAAHGFTPDALELVNFGQPYFDPNGLIIAWEGDTAVGFVHAGFGCTPAEDALSRDVGVICALMVRSDRRREGIGRELLRRGEAYLRDRGAQTLQAGQSRQRDPFYFGLYGGARPSGFLTSDADAGPFFRACGYQPRERFAIFQRNLEKASDPIHFRLLAIRRATELVISDQPTVPTWWWFCRMGRIDSLRFRLCARKGGPPIASVSVVGLDAYVAGWNTRAIGLVDVAVRPEDRGKGYGRALLVEVIRHMRQELIALAEIHAPEEHEVAVKAILGAGFERVDTGITYVRGDS